MEGLSGTALRVAQTMDFSELSKPEAGVEKLLATFEKELKLRRAQQARELYAAGSAPRGILSRQNGETMASYILRRRTWYRCLVDTSDDMKLPDIVLAGQLLSSANISADHQLLVRTALQGNITFDRVADELVSQHSRLHEREKSRNFVHKKPFYGYQQNRKGSGKWHGAFYADETAQHDQAYSEDFSEETYEPEEPYVSDEIDPIEEHIGFMVNDGVDFDDPESAEAAAEVLQAEQEAYFVKKGAAQKGKGSGPKHFAVSGSLSLEERKAKIASLKSRTTCRKCGAVGHWSGDSQCPGSKGGARKGKYRPGSTSGSSQMSTTASKGSPAKSRTVYFAVHEPSSAGGSHGYMALRGEGFHAVPPPSSLTGQHEHAQHGPPHGHALHGTQHEHVLHGPPHELALHALPHEHVPQDALVPAHESLVPAETRPHWVDLSHGEVGHGEMRGRVHEMPFLFPQRPLTNDEKEEMMPQQALGRLAQPSLPMDVDGLGMIENQRGALPAGVPPLPVRALPAEHAMRPEQASSSTPRQVPAAGPDERPEEGPFSPQPANYQQTVCQHERVTSRGTNKFVRMLRCLDCQLLLERERIPQVSFPKACTS